MLKRVNFNNKVTWFVIILSLAVITGIAIADTKRIYFGIVLIPFILYICIEKPFIFPFGLYVLLLPFDSLLSVMGTAQGATLTKILGMLTILSFLLKGAFENKFKKPDAVSLWFILFIMYGVLSLMWAIQPDVVISRIPTAVSLLILYLVVTNYQIQKNEFEILKWCIFFGGCIVALTTVYKSYTENFIDNAQRMVVSYGDRVGNPNGLAFCLLFPFSVCIEMMLKNNKKLIIRSLFVIMLGVIAYCVVITGSRGGGLSMGIIIITYILFSKQRLTLGTILIVVVIVIFSLIPEFLVERWSHSVDDGGSGRLNIWYAGLEILKKYWPIGAGMGNFPNAHSLQALTDPSFAYEGYGRDPHNVYIGIFVEFGIVGFSFIIWGVIKHYKAINPQFIQNDGTQIMLKAAFFGMLTANLFSTFIWHKSFWLLWMMILMYRNVLIHNNNYDH